LNDFLDRIARSTTKIENAAFAASHEIAQRSQMGISQIQNVQIIPNRRPVAGGMIITIDLEALAQSQNPLQLRRSTDQWHHDSGNKVRFRIMGLPYPRIRRSPGDIEISQNRRPHADRLQDFFRGEFGFSVGVDRPSGIVLR